VADGGCQYPKGANPQHLDPKSCTELSMAFTGVHSVHTVHKKGEKPSKESIFSIVSMLVAHELHTKFIEINRERRLK
jgi:hypothetical protein